MKSDFLNIYFKIFSKKLIHENSYNSPSFSLKDEKKRPLIIRYQLLVLAAIAFLASFWFLDSNFPFSKFLCVIAAISFVVHILSYIFFNYLGYFYLVFLTRFNVFLLLAGIHFSGGITSPFLVIYVCILMSEIFLGIKESLNIILILISFLLLIFLEYFQLIKPYPLSNLDIYKSGISTFFITLNILTMILITGLYSKIIFHRLKLRLEEEQFLKDKMSKEMSRLESSAQLGFLVTRIAHDIRGPMAAIKGYAQLAGSTPGLDEELKNDWLTVEHEVNRVVGLIEKMQRFIRPGTGQRNYVSLIEILEVVTTVICLEEKMRRIKLVKKYPKEDVMIYANAEELQQAFFNLLKNALEAIDESAPEDGEIQVKVTEDESWIITSIKDTGIGMSPEIKQQIFANFFTTKGNGMGLGMGIISDIIYGHEGKIEVNSESGKGTEILVFLPKKKENGND